MEVTGKLVCTPDAKQPFEIQAESISVLGLCDHDYPLQKKRHSFEFMREIHHCDVLVQIHTMLCLG